MAKRTAAKKRNKVARWSTLQSKAKQPTIRILIDDAMVSNLATIGFTGEEGA